jgi:hypothetical protein
MLGIGEDRQYYQHKRQETYQAGFLTGAERNWVSEREGDTWGEMKSKRRKMEKGIAQAVVM